MVTRRRFSVLPFLILTLAVLPALSACHSAPGEPPLSPQALAAVSPHSGAPREALARAIDSLFTDERGGDTRALLILHNGRIVAERYDDDYGPRTRFPGWSMSSSVTGVLIGLLVSDGRLRLDAPVPIPLWQRAGDPRGAITLRQLLQMRSGLEHREDTKPRNDSDMMRMEFLDGRNDMAAYAEAQPLIAAPGAGWNYSTATDIILADLAAQVLTTRTEPDARRQAVADFLRARLFEPAGLGSMVADYDSAGTLIGSNMLYATARDWGRFGELLRNEGAVKGAQIVPRDWVSFMTEPSPANPGYGAHLWLNRPQIDGQQVLFPARGPASLFACAGHLGQYILVLPHERLTIVRLGKSDETQRPILLNRLADIIALFRGD